MYPVYRGPTILTLQSLAKRLEIDEHELISISYSTSQLYETYIKLKPDGTPRPISKVKEPLKNIQKTINCCLFDFIEYPPYIKSTRGRGYLANIESHIVVHPKTLINEDIKNFFPSIHEKHVLEIWTNIFGFTEQVAKVLTRLTTFNNSVAQGACTSSNIANLVLHKKEPDFVKWLTDSGFHYTRYVDDISITSTTRLTHQDIGEITAKLHYMINSCEFRLKRTKRSVTHSGQRMLINKRCINSGKPTSTKEARNILRAEVHHFQKNAKDNTPTAMASLLGKISIIESAHPNLADKFKKAIKQKESSSNSKS